MKRLAKRCQGDVLVDTFHDQSKGRINLCPVSENISPKTDKDKGFRTLVF